MSFFVVEFLDTMSAGGSPLPIPEKEDKKPLIKKGKVVIILCMIKCFHVFHCGWPAVFLTFRIILYVGLHFKA